MASSVARRVKQYRDKMEAAGLRPLQIWVPDTKRPGFAAECRRQSLVLRDDPAERDMQDWIDAAFDTEGWQ
jgi:hypothetical protein